jgi:hypothetical protein
VKVTGAPAYNSASSQHTPCTLLVELAVMYWNLRKTKQSKPTEAGKWYILLAMIAQAIKNDWLATHHLDKNLGMKRFLDAAQGISEKAEGHGKDPDYSQLITNYLIEHPSNLILPGYLEDLPVADQEEVAPAAHAGVKMKVTSAASPPRKNAPATRARGRNDPPAASAPQKNPPNSQAAGKKDPPGTRSLARKEAPATQPTSRVAHAASAKGKKKIAPATAWHVTQNWPPASTTSWTQEKESEPIKKLQKLSEHDEAANFALEDFWAPEEKKEQAEGG